MEVIILLIICFIISSLLMYRPSIDTVYNESSISIVLWYSKPYTTTRHYKILFTFDD